MTIDDMLAAIVGRTLDLSDRGLTALPDDLSPLAAKVQRLDVSKNALTALPDSIGTLTKLTTLVATDNALTALPDTLDTLTALKTLDVRRNKLKAMPASLAGCTSLTTLRMAANALKAVPDVLWSRGGIQKMDGIKGYANGRKYIDFITFYHTIHKVDRDPAARARVFDLFRGKPHSETSTIELFEALTFPVETVRDTAQAELLRRGPYADAPVAAGSKVVILGTIHGRKTDIKERLKAVDAAYGIKIDARTTHVVVGKNPKKWDGVDREGLTFCTEQTLMATLDTLDTPYLVEEAQESPEAAQDVAEMLLSPDRDTVALGLELLTAGGVPPDVQTALFYVGKGLGDKKLGAKARKLLKVHGPPGVRKAVANRSKLFSTGDKAEKKTADALWSYRHQAPELDWPAMALLIKRDHGVGLRFVIEQTKVGDPVRMRALRMMISDGTLDLFQGFAGYMPDYFNAYAHYDRVTMPTEIYGFAELTGLSLRGCRIRALPEGISALRNLRSLNLDGNFLERLPKDFGQLDALEHLDLGRNRFDVFPTAQICALKNLRSLRFIGNRAKSIDERPQLSEVPAAVRAALPECAITDGLHQQQEWLSYRWKTT